MARKLSNKYLALCELSLRVTDASNKSETCEKFFKQIQGDKYLVSKPSVLFIAVYRLMCLKKRVENEEKSNAQIPEPWIRLGQCFYHSYEFVETDSLRVLKKNKQGR